MLGRTGWGRRRRFSEKAVRVKGVEDRSWMRTDVENDYSILKFSQVIGCRSREQSQGVLGH
jgi:hypothetical protein